MSKKNGDLILLKRRLKYLVEVENYEKAAVIKRWIDELTLFYSKEHLENVIPKIKTQ